MITVFTPTYNRAYILHRVYDSLLQQTVQKFVWLIIDDGSTDNTKELVKQWINENKIIIKYIYQENSGKSQAHNNAVLNTDTELFLCLDSDDYLTNNAIELIVQYEQELKSNEYAGIIALKGTENGSFLNHLFPKSIKRCTLFSLYEKYGYKGETALVYKTQILKQFLFPMIKNEKFIPEPFVYDQIDQKYKMILMNKVIYIFEYFNDGYTSNMKKNIIRNSNGYMLYHFRRLEHNFSLKQNIKSSAGYVAGALISKRFIFLKKIIEYPILIIGIPLGLLIFAFRFNFGKWKE